MMNDNYNMPDGDLKQGSIIVFSVSTGVIGSFDAPDKCYGEVIDSIGGIVYVEILWSDLLFLIGAKMPIAKTLIEGFSTYKEVEAISVIDG